VDERPLSARRAIRYNQFALNPLQHMSGGRDQGIVALGPMARHWPANHGNAATREDAMTAFNA
jgi:hypothetical protein